MDNRSIFLQNLAQTSDFPLCLEFEKAEGIYLIDKEGKKYIDLISGIAVSNVGHRHPKVTQAIKDQVDKYLHQMVYGEFIQSPQVKLAKKLTDTLANYRTKDQYVIDNVYLVNSGTEAVEAAIKLAKRYTGRPEIVAYENAYHGSTTGALSLGNENFKTNFRPLMPGIRKIRREAIEDLQFITQNTAAVFYEPIGGESGVKIGSIAYLTKLYERCLQTGTLLIFDEIQSGMKRTGTLWAFEKHGIAPDILLSAKALGGGMPIGAMMAPHEIMGVFKDNPILGHITTFGGHPVSAAAALATLEVLEAEFDDKEIKAKGDLFKLQLSEHRAVKEVRGEGLMLAAEMRDFELLQKVIGSTIAQGVITDWFLYCDNAMRIAPPLCISEDEITRACDIIKAALDQQH